MRLPAFRANATRAEVLRGMQHGRGCRLSVYAQVVGSRDAHGDALDSLVGATDWAVMGRNPVVEEVGDASQAGPAEAENPAVAGPSREAADGIRTHDLLHGKQTL
jgi:hypothetical protein